MADQRTMICERCKGSFQISQMKFGKKGDDSYMPLCVDCIKKAQNAVLESKPGRRISSSANSAKKKYRCLKCRYSFTHLSDTERSLVCPYCGKSDSVIEDKVDAKSLLKNIEEDRFMNL